MTAVDPFTAASPTYRAAASKPFKQGSAFTVGKPRHTASHGLTTAAVAFTIMGAAYCLASGARTVAHSLSHPAVVAEAGR